MRYLLTLLLSTTALLLTAQTTQYVWAPSGLTLRAEGHSGAEKVGVIPYGSKVKLTGQVGERISVPVFKAFTVKFYEDMQQSLSWSMEDVYVEVDYEGEKGWLFAGYLYRFMPPTLVDGQGSFYPWLETIGGEQEELFSASMREVNFREQSVYRYDHGITQIDEYGEGWGSTTWSIPLGTLNDGYLLGEVFFNLSATLQGAKEGEEESYMILDKVEWNQLHFSEEMSELSIVVVGGMLLITSSGGC